MIFRVPDNKLLPWDPKENIDVKRVMKALGVPLQTVYNLIQDGSLRAYRFRTRGPWRIQRSSLEEFAASLHKEHGLEKRF